MLETTDNGIEFDWHITGPQGVRFCLYPIKDKHSEEDVKAARRDLYYNHDVVSIQVRWKLKDDKSDPPEKIPDLVIIKELREELGKLKSYIDELEDKLKQGLIQEREALQKENSKKRQEIMKEELYKKIKSDNSKLKKEIIKLRENISDLVVRLNKAEAAWVPPLFRKAEEVKEVP